jgi:hypothetical protein
VFTDAWGKKVYEKNPDFFRSLTNEKKALKPGDGSTSEPAGEIS